MRKKTQQKRKINENIENDSVRILDQKTNHLSDFINIGDAIQQARDQNLDLILIDVKEGICIIGNAGKFFYNQKKNQKTNKAPKIKEFSIGFKIDHKDIEIKATNISKVLNSGNNVYIKMFVPRKKLLIEDNRNKALEQLHKIIATVKTVSGIDEKKLKIVEKAQDISVNINKLK